MSRARLFFALLCLALTLSACATGRTAPDMTLEPTGFRAPVSRGPAAGEAVDHTPYLDVYDPLEGMNRSIYQFNAWLDQWVLIPAVDAYRAVAPEPARKGVSNALDNLGDVGVLLNCLLQGKFGAAGTTLGRLLMNSTFGLLGLVDVATPAGLERQNEDLGQTLGVWGLESGPYLVLPVFGPSNLRDTAGLAGDWYVSSWEMEQIHNQLGTTNHEAVDWPLAVLRVVDTRSRQPFRYWGTDSPFEYDLIRYLFTKKRELDVQK